MTVPSHPSDILGFHVRVGGAPVGLRDLLRESWPEARGDPPRGSVEYRTEAGPPPVLVTPAGRRPLDPRRPGVHAYHLLLADVFGRVDDAFAVHASAVAGSGGAALILGPSGHGKTTLALALAARGAGFLSDDVGLIVRRDGTVRAVPRTIHLRPGTRRLFSPEARQRAEASRVAIDGERWMVDPLRWFGPSPADAGLDAVFVIESEDEVVTLVTVSGSAAALEDLARRAGVDAIDRTPSAETFQVKLSSPEGFEEWRREHADVVIAAVKGSSAPPDYSGPPKIRDLMRFDAAVALARHVLNRHSGSRLAAEFEGRAIAMVLEIAALLRDVRCFGLRPGRFDDTVALVASRLDR